MTTDAFIAQACELFNEALQEKSPAILSALQDSADGKHGFGASFKLTYVGSRIYITGTLQHSTKDSCEFEGSIEVEDPTNPKLPGIDDDSGPGGGK